MAENSIQEDNLSIKHDELIFYLLIAIHRNIKKY